MHDVIVVGGGPAGAATALRLARQGFDALVVERARFPRSKPCGEYLSPAALRGLDELGLRDSLCSCAAPLLGVRLAGGGARVELPLRDPGWSLSRAILDDAVLGAALAAGASVVRGRVEALEVERECAAVTMRLPGGEIETRRARIVVGADGAHSLVAKICGLTKDDGRTARFALGGHLSGLPGLERRVQMFVDGPAYFAVNPLGEELANVMLVVEASELRGRRDDIDAFFRERADALSGGVLNLAGARMQGKRVAIGPLAHRTVRPTAPRVFLAGDAAQAIDPFSGQGVYLALFAARLAALEIAAILRGEPEAPARARYERGLGAELRRRERLARAAAKLVRMPRLAPFARLFSPLLGAIAG